MHLLLRKRNGELRIHHKKLGKELGKKSRKEGMAEISENRK